MFDFSDPFGFKRRKREKMERLIAPYVRPGDDELTRKAIYLALSDEFFGTSGYNILQDDLGMEHHVIAATLLKLRDRGISSAAEMCEFMDFQEEDLMPPEKRAEYEELREILEGAAKKRRR